MSTFFAILNLLSIVLFVIGMVKPAVVIRWGNQEQRTRKKVALVYLGLFLVSIIMAGVTAPGPTPEELQKSAEKRAEIQAKRDEENKKQQDELNKQQEELKKQQQEAFQTWYANFDNVIKKYDQSLQICKDTFTEIGEGRLNRYQAYSNLKPQVENMKYFKSTFYALKPPSNLSKEHQKLITDAASDLGTMAYCKQKGIENVLEFLDSMKPSSMQQAKEEFQSGDAFMMSGLAKIIKVKTDLGLNEKK